MGAILIEVIAILLLYSIVFGVLKITGSANVKQYTFKSICCFALITVICEVIIFRKVINERFVYYWDYSGYWVKTVEASRSYLSNPIEAILRMYYSIQHDEYNDFVCLFTSLPLQLIGETYVSYIMIVYNMFLLPTLVIIACTGKKFLRKLNISVPFNLMYFIVSMSPVFFFPVANGYVDAFALLFAALLMLLAIDINWLKPKKINCILIGILIPICMIARRYFVFYLIGYVVFLGIYGLGTGIKKKSPYIILSFLKAYSCIGIVALGIFLLFFREMFINSLLNSYSTTYSAYSFGGIQNKIGDIVGYIGGIYVVFALCGVIIGARNSELHIISLGLVLGIISICAAFFSIQNMGIHHVYVVSIPICLFVCLFIGSIYCNLSNRQLKKIQFYICVSIIGANMLYGWIEPQFNSINRYKIFPSFHCVPLQRNDIDVLRSINFDLLQLNKPVYVLGSSSIINDDILRRINFPYDYKTPILLSCSHVDLRDGFPKEFIDAELIVVANPVQIHLTNDTQRVVSALSQHFINNTSIAQHYEPIKTYYLDNGVSATLYSKISPWETDDYITLREEFDGYYPEYPELFKERILAY